MQNESEKTLLAQQHNLQKASILIVDDDKDASVLLRRILVNSGFEKVAVTDSVPAALEKASNGQLDLILSDWNMPGLSGIDFLREIRRFHVCKTLPFVMLTAHADKDRVIEAIGAGVNGYVVKSMATQVLPVKVIEVLGNKSQQASRKA